MSADTLVIAANYEEYSYMYYLGSKVIVGYVGNNLEEDAKLVPDIIAYRKMWPRFAGLFNHRFKTFHTDAPRQATYLYVKRNGAAN